jgi:hypothetical protein
VVAGARASTSGCIVRGSAGAPPPVVVAVRGVARRGYPLQSVVAVNKKSPLHSVTLLTVPVLPLRCTSHTASFPLPPSSNPSHPTRPRSRPCRRTSRVKRS